jgi:hypothetical protein
LPWQSSQHGSISSHQRCVLSRRSYLRTLSHGTNRDRVIADNRGHSMIAISGSFGGRGAVSEVHWMYHLMISRSKSPGHPMGMGKLSEPVAVCAAVRIGPRQRSALYESDRTSEYSIRNQQCLRCRRASCEGQCGLSPGPRHEV